MKLALPASWHIDGKRWRLTLSRPDDNGEVTLKSDRIFILPTAYGLLFIVMLLVMLVGSINYNNNLGFILTFLLGSLGLVSILHTYRNIAKIRVRAGKFAPVFAGQQAQFTVHIHNAANTARHAIVIQIEKLFSIVSELPACSDGHAAIPIVTQQRGRYPLGTLRIESVFPLGLLRAWAYVKFNTTYLVYPKPLTMALPLEAIGDDEGGSVGKERGVDEYVGVRNYTPGDPARQIHWKALAKGQPLQTKQFTRNQSQTLWLDWNLLPNLDTETRLGIICHWVLDAQENSRTYGLRLPGLELPPDNGETHRKQCLEALAEFGLPSHVGV